ncbi:MAG: outer membrane beta-barrel protein [bacterium]
MKRFAVCVWTLIVCASFASAAHAQFAVPAQRPSVEPAGSFILYPTLGVVHDGDPDFTDVAIMIRGRYSLLDQLSVSAQLGGAFGDADDFVFGFGTKFQLMDQTSNLPVQVSLFGAFDVAIGDLDAQSLAFGPLIGHRFDMGNVALTPYGGFAVGFTHASIDTGNDDADSEGNTDALFGIILGSDLALSRELSADMEFTLGATDGLPVLNWHFGVAYALLSAPKYVPPPPSNYGNY